MKKLRWQLLIIFLTGLVIGILLLSEQPGGSTITSQPVAGGTYTEAMIGSLERLNPLLDFYNQADRDIDRLIYSSLLSFDDRGLPIAGLAEAWSVSQDGSIYNFTLRSGLTWHDNTPLTADDVVFTIEMLRSGEGVVPADLIEFWNGVSVVALDDTHLQFILPEGESFAPFLDYLTFGILPRHILGDLSFESMVNSAFNLQPIGSGPYQFSRLVLENDQIAGVELTAFENYLPQSPYLQRLVFRYYPDGGQAFAAYQAGLVQGISNVSLDILQSVLDVPGLATYSGRLPELSTIFFNLNNSETAFLQEPDVRRALLMAINRQRVISSLLQGQAMIADGVIFPGTWAYYSGTPRVEYNPEAARQLLIDAGYTLPAEEGAIRSNAEGQQMRFTLLYPDDEFHRQLAEFIQVEWDGIGVGVDLEAVPYDQLVNDRLSTHNYQAALVDISFARTPDPDPYPFWDQAMITNGQNYSQWDNRMASEYLEQARITLNLNDRIRFYRNFQVLFSNDLPALPLYYPVYTFAMTTDVQGVSIGPLMDTSDRFNTILDWFLLSSRPVGNADTTVPGE